MQKFKLKRLIALALAITMLLPAGSYMNAYADDEEEATTASSDTSDSSDSDEDSDSSDSSSELVTPAEVASKEEQAEAKADLEAKITDEQALEMCELIVSEGDLSLYFDEEHGRACLLDESNGSKNYWWTSPINAEADDTILDQTKSNPYMKTAQRTQIQSGIVITYGDRDNRTTDTVYSGTPAKKSSAASIEVTKNSDGCTITYTFEKLGFTIPVDYVLDEEGMTVSCDTSKIEESKGNDSEGLVLTDIQLTPFFGAAPETDAEGNAVEGYMIIPDGSGAVINYNNGKGNYATTYSQKVYGRNYTTVPLSQPQTTEQVYMPLAAHVSGNKALVAIVTDGDADCSVNAQINGQSNQTYNSVYFDFELRGSDDYELSGENGSLKVFEKGKIKAGTLSIKYYPLSSESEDINYADVAKVYRDYLVEAKEYESKVEENQTQLYIDLFGGVIKSKSILGIPFDLQTEITTFDQAQTILDKLKDAGAEDIIVQYNDWTSKSIDGKISTSASAASVVEGDSDMEELLEYAKDNSVTIYPSMDNMEMESSTWGYFTFTSTAIKVSNSYSRQSRYNPAFGEESGVSPALLTPTVYTKVFSEMIESYVDEGIENIAFGGYSSKLVSDYSSSNYSNRKTTMETIIEGYKDAGEKVGSVLADEANAYLLPYVDQITNVPVCSSGFNIVDYDIPLYQMIVHGYVPYSTTAINKSSNSDETFLLALAYGAAIHYDMIYADASELEDTDYNDLYYANYKGWVDMAANQATAADKVLSSLSKYVIINYEYDEENNIAKTTYGTEDGDEKAVVEVDLDNKTVTVDGTAVDVSDCLEEGGED